MKSLKVLVLVYKGLEPPASAPKDVVDWADWKTEYHVVRSLKKLGHKPFVLGVSDDLSLLQKSIEDFQPDIVFNLLEEFAGQAVFDKNIVSYLELLGLPYTGVNPQGLGLGRDKALAKQILHYHGITTPAFFVVPIGGKVEIPSGLSFPMIVKSLVEEASLGISQKSVVRSPESLVARVEFIHGHLGTSALVESYVEGRELYVGVVGNQKLEVFKPWELSFGNLKSHGVAIATRRVKFNKAYCEKLNIHRKAAKNLCPAQRKNMERLCRKAYRALKLSGYARMDLRLSEDGQIHFIEVNPNPELAKGEDFANAARLSGWTYEDLIQCILEQGLAWEPVQASAA